jgi:NADH:ubiquinone oxidoreductase subunit 6 (subunit J)
MNSVQILFYVFAAVVVFGGVAMVFTRNVLYAAFALLIALLGLAAVYVCLFADFLAISQLMIYVGGVLVLILFGLMLSMKQADASAMSPSKSMKVSLVVCGGLLAGLLHLIFRSGITQLPGLEKPVGFLSQKTTVYRLGVELMTTFALPFEVASVILLATLAGAAYLSTGNSNRKI